MIDFILLSTQYDSWLFFVIGFVVTAVSVGMAFVIAFWELKGCMGVIIRVPLILLILGLPLLWYWNNETETESDRMNNIIHHLILVLAISPILWNFFNCSMESHDRPQNTKREEPKNPYSHLPHRGKRISKKSKKAS